MGVVERKEREKAERRKAILETARDLIRTRPFEEITMEDIAKRLELARATLYLYFRNKNEIFTTLLTLGMGDLCTAYEKVNASGIKDPVENLKQMAIAFLQFYAQNSSYFDLIVTHRKELLKDVSDDVGKDFDSAGAAVIRPVANAYQAGVDAGKFRAVDPEKMAFLLRAMAIGMAVGFREGNLKFPEDLMLAERMIMHGMLTTP